MSMKRHASIAARMLARFQGAKSMREENLHEYEESLKRNMDVASSHMREIKRGLSLYERAMSFGGNKSLQYAYGYMDDAIHSAKLAREYLHEFYEYAIAVNRSILRIKEEDEEHIPIENLTRALAAIQKYHGGYTYRNGLLKIITPKIVLTHNGVDVDLGNFEFVFNPQKFTNPLKSITINTHEGNKTAHGFPSHYHPHVNNGSPCLGDGLAPITQALRRGDLDEAYEMTLLALSEYNHESPYVRLSEWFTEEQLEQQQVSTCCNCESMLEDDEVQATESGRTICVNCLIVVDNIKYAPDEVVYSEILDEYIPTDQAVSIRGNDYTWEDRVVECSRCEENFDVDDLKWTNGAGGLCEACTEEMEEEEEEEDEALVLHTCPQCHIRFMGTDPAWGTGLMGYCVSCSQQRNLITYPPPTLPEERQCRRCRRLFNIADSNWLNGRDRVCTDCLDAIDHRNQNPHLFHGADTLWAP